MKDRQRRRSIKWYLRVGVVVALAEAGGAWYLTAHSHLDVWSVLVAVVMAGGFLVAVATMVICWNISASHEATRKRNDAALAKAVEVVERRQLALVGGYRVCSTTRYIPHRDLEPNRAATVRDLLADQTGDISDYR